jgi:hypothetical protein
MYAGDYLNVSVRIPELKFPQNPLLQFDLVVRCPVCKSNSNICHFAEVRPDYLRILSEVVPHQLSYDDETSTRDLPPFSEFTRYIIANLAQKRICESCGVSSEIPKADVHRLRRQCEGYDLRPWVFAIIMELGCIIKIRGERTPNDHMVDAPYFRAEGKAGISITFDPSVTI